VILQGIELRNRSQSSMPLTQLAKPLLDTLDGNHGNELLQPRFCIESGGLFFVQSFHDVRWRCSLSGNGVNRGVVRFRLRV
jgi:hypothetical protein